MKCASPKFCICGGEELRPPRSGLFLERYPLSCRFSLSIHEAGDLPRPAAAEGDAVDSLPWFTATAKTISGSKQGSTLVIAVRSSE